MILKTLWIQRICGYDGEYAPECLCAVDTYSYEEYPVSFDRQCTTELDQLRGIISAHQIIDIEVDVDKIANILNHVPKIEGKIE